MLRRRHPWLVLLVVNLLLTASYEETTSVGPKRACDEASTVEIRDGKLLKNGSLLSADGLLFPPDLFWETFSSEEGTRVVRGCVCLLKSCIRKCCRHDHVYHVPNSAAPHCESSNHPTLRDHLVNVTRVQDAEEYSEHHLLFGHKCANMFPMAPHEVFQLDDKGVWQYVDKNSNFTDPTNHDGFCIDVMVNNGSAYLGFLQCVPPQDEPEEKHWTFAIFPIGMIISEPFLIATFFVYGVVPELRNIHGKNLMSHCTSIFVAYLFLATVQFDIINHINAFCVSAAFIIQFSFLASFFWLNIMCFDLWWTFSGCRPMRGSMRERDHKKFIIYSMYSWGCPLIILIVTMTMDLTPSISDDYAKPRFGNGRCWFQKENSGAMWAYFYGPVAIILTANMLMFITTAVKIVKLKKETAMLQTSTESKRHDDEDNNQRFSLYLKLFVVMGVNWVMEVISWAVGGPDYIWFVTDMGNTLQGVLIFIIFVWKDKVRKLLRKRFSDSADSKSQQYSTASKSTRVFSSTRSSLRNTSANASQNDFNMSPVARNA